MAIPTSGASYAWPRSVPYPLCSVAPYCRLAYPNREPFLSVRELFLHTREPFLHVRELFLHIRALILHTGRPYLGFLSFLRLPLPTAVLLSAHMPTSQPRAGT